MTALHIVTYILGTLLLALLFVAEYIAVVICQEEKLARLSTGRSSDMYVSEEEYEEKPGGL